MDIKKKIITGITIILILFIGIHYLYTKGYFLPKYIQWNTIEIEEDLNQDGKKEIIRLNQKKASIQFDESFYEFNKDWLISDLKIDDIDQDGTKEILMLVWNRTNYGDYKPFWEENDTIHFSQHLYVFNVTENGIHSKWMSSQLKPNIKEWIIKNHILECIDPNQQISNWQWNSFGFEKIN